jgi:hypothetical protein
MDKVKKKIHNYVYYLSFYSSRGMEFLLKWPIIEMRMCISLETSILCMLIDWFLWNTMMGMPLKALLQTQQTGWWSYKPPFHFWKVGCVAPVWTCYMRKYRCHLIYNIANIKCVIRKFCSVIHLWKIRALIWLVGRKIKITWCRHGVSGFVITDKSL